MHAETRIKEYILTGQNDCFRILKFTTANKNFETQLNDLADSKKDLVDLDNNRKEILRRLNAEYAKTNVEIKKSEETLTNVLALTKLVWGEIKSGGNKWIEIDDKLSKVGRTIGLSTQQIRGYQKNILANYFT